MTRFKQTIDEYVKSDNVVDMLVLTEMLDEFISDCEEHHPEKVENLIMCLKMYKHPFKNKERAEYAVSKLINADGTTGEHWDYDTTSRVAEKYNISDKPVFYYVLNTKYSIYYDSSKTDSDYIRDAKKFMEDKNAPHDKAERYYRAMNYHI